MSYDDNNRHDPERGVYTPPTDDDLHVRRHSFDARSPQSGRGSMPPMLVISLIVLVLVLIVVGLVYGLSGVRGRGEPPAVAGSSAEQLTGPPPVEAQPIEREADISAYDPAPAVAAETPQFAPEPEPVEPRPQPAPQPVPAPAPVAQPAPPRPAPTPAPAPAPIPTPAPAPEPAAPVAAASAVQIGAYGSREAADREYAAVAAAFPDFARGRTKRVEAVTSAAGQTLYRTTFNGFTRQEAQSFCAALRAAGRDCLVR